MLDPANNRDKDLNTVRSAMNQYFEDGGGERVVLGHTVRTIISKFKLRMEEMKMDDGWLRRRQIGIRLRAAPQQCIGSYKQWDRCGGPTATNS